MILKLNSTTQLYRAIEKWNVQFMGVKPFKILNFVNISIMFLLTIITVSVLAKTENSKINQQGQNFKGWFEINFRTC